MIDKFNRNHDAEQCKKVLNPKCAKQHIEAKSQKNGTDNIILSIKSVYKHLNCYEIKWTNSSSLKPYFNGRYEKYKRNGINFKRGIELIG